MTALEIIFRTVEIEFFEQKGSKILRHCPFKLTRQNVLDPLFYLYFHVYINPNLGFLVHLWLKTILHQDALSYIFFFKSGMGRTLFHQSFLMF